MGHSGKKKTEQEEYQFIKETIKKKPLDKKKIIRKVFAIVWSGALFGACAAAAFVSLSPLYTQYFGKKTEKTEDISITANGAVQEQDELESSQVLKKEDEEEETAAVQNLNEDSKEEVGRPLDLYEELYGEALQVSEEPRKALVKVSGLSKDENLLDDSFVSYGATEGILFLETQESVFVLTYADDLVDAANIQITFTDGTTAAGTVCGMDKQTNLAVVKISIEDIGASTWKKISIANFNTEESALQAKPVIAIGSPQGNEDAVIYGMVTSLTGRMLVADAEYNLIATEMHASASGTGVILNTNGEVIGLIVKQNEGTDVIRAYSLKQIAPVIEQLSNAKPILYLGIHGISVTKNQRNTLGIPAGIYVDSVENDSPAMAAGIQNGDIITELDGKSVGTMEEYSSYLQNMEMGDRVPITLKRRDAVGEYVDIEFRVTIEKR